MSNPVGTELPPAHSGVEPPHPKRRQILIIGLFIASFAYSPALVPEPKNVERMEAEPTECRTALNQEVRGWDLRGSQPAQLQSSVKLLQ